MNTMEFQILTMYMQNVKDMRADYWIVTVSEVTTLSILTLLESYVSNKNPRRSPMQ